MFVVLGLDRLQGFPRKLARGFHFRLGPFLSRDGGRQLRGFTPAGARKDCALGVDGISNPRLKHQPGRPRRFGRLILVYDEWP